MARGKQQPPCSNFFSNTDGGQLNRVLTVGYVVSTWPRLSQTFVLTEFVALVKCGVPLRIFSVKDPGGEPVHAKVGQVRAAVTYLSFRRGWKRIVLANIRLARELPGRYWRALWHAVSYRRFGIV